MRGPARLGLGEGFGKKFTGLKRRRVFECFVGMVGGWLFFFGGFLKKVWLIEEVISSF